MKAWAEHYKWIIGLMVLIVLGMSGTLATWAGSSIKEIHDHVSSPTPHPILSQDIRYSSELVKQRIDNLEASINDRFDRLEKKLEGRK